MNHIRERRNTRRRIILERIICAAVFLFTWLIIAAAWIQVAFFDLPDSYGLAMAAVGFGAQAITFRYWSILDEEEGVER